MRLTKVLDSYYALSPTSNPFQQNDKNPDSFQQYDEDSNPFYQNKEKNIYALFSSSSKPFHFHIPTPITNKNNEVDNEYNIDQGEENSKDGDDKDNINKFFAFSEINNNKVFLTKILNDSIETEIIIWVFKY
ncbi:hypothetical protein C1645_834608 [Glomus cerebriforme]|uniref:Uncharacterized protein n=1 Tax=Glomus cerebriforme TaxID=658196 RepID=A0A397SBQ8_9GLOM|nr:hypothetical protein C1645_834608 [Glomus cerebriforme]